MADYFDEKLADATARVPTMEHLLGKGLNLPFANVNSGPRKIMSSVHRDHVLALFGGEKAITETGYEIRFGDQSSSIDKTDDNYKVVAKISKFSFSPNHDYILVLANDEKKKLVMKHRISYEYITESYGFLYNNSYMDNLQPGQYIPKDTIVQKSLAFDEYMNRKDGVNLITAYMSLDQNMEDSIILSDTAAAKLTSPLIKKVDIMINENDIPLNIYGTEDNYKCIPDIGEDIKDSILIALRKEKKEEMVYTESSDMLRKVLMSDVRRTLNGTVIDVDIYCNNVNNLDAYHNQQFKMYYNETQRRAQEIVSLCTAYQAQGYQFEYALDKEFALAKRILNHDQFEDKKPFSNIMLKLTVLEHLQMKEGDKIANRFGGKGVTSKILPHELMPRVKKTGQYVDILMNGSTMYGRMNPGQIFEVDINRFGAGIVHHIVDINMPVNDALSMIVLFATKVSPEYGNSLSELFSNMNDYDRKYYLDSIIRDGHIDISTMPISDSFDIDRLMDLYDTFPFITKDQIEVPIKDSNGNYRYVTAHRSIVVGPEYFFRLKQYAEEKFSATSLSAVNIRGNNTKSKANKNFIEPYSNTPIRFGNMEINSESHLGAEVVITNLMLHSVSPHARQLVSQMYLDDPYHVNIMLDGQSKNRGAEIVNAYLKVIGRRLIFEKVPKRRIKLSISPLFFDDPQVVNPIFFEKPGFDFNKYYKEQTELEKQTPPDRSGAIKPLYFEGRDLRRYQEEEKNNEEAYEYIHTPMKERLKFKKDNEE